MNTPFSILLVDDDETLDMHLRALLKDYPPSVCRVTTQAEAVAHLQCYRPDMILIDIGLPDSQGYTICEAIRGQTAESSSVILATTAYYTAETAQEVLARRFDGYLLKPFAAHEVIPFLETAV